MELDRRLGRFDVLSIGRGSWRRIPGLQDTGISMVSKGIGSVGTGSGFRMKEAVVEAASH